MDWSFVGTFPAWFPFSFADGQIYPLVEAVFRLCNLDLCGELGEDTVFPARDIIWSLASADCCGMEDDVRYMLPSQHKDPEVLDIPSTSLPVVEAKDVDIDAESD